jgi:maltooligosyltrehalose trehalohydrolase
MNAPDPSNRFDPLQAPDGRFRHRMSFGAEVGEDGVSFRLWAPLHDAVGLTIEGESGARAMAAGPDGWHVLHASDVGPGALYKFVLPGGVAVPDPASRFQPRDVHGPSEVIDPEAYRWKTPHWRGRPWEECILYELHVGAFTPQGTFLAALERLDRLVALGVTAIELMPIADFPGDRSWGYDGVLPYAPDSSYGRPDDLKALVDGAHARGLMVFLDVVYNHFGPEGNYLPLYAPIFTERHKTPWGDAMNLDGPGAEPVRDFLVQNAIYWIEEYGFDGLRLDAVHALPDASPRHILEDIAAGVRAAAKGRFVHLVVENEENDAGRIARDPAGAPRQYSAQINDDLHHVLHTAVTGEGDGYYADYAGRTILLGRALAEGFAFQGEMMDYRGTPRGAPSAALPPTAFVAFLQNHDQIGNRALGDRITAGAPVAAVRAAAAICLLCPEIPMLFMGEEWAAAQSFPYFCDFEPPLAEAVRQGRQMEFARFPQFASADLREQLPDPTSRATFLSAKLRWEDAAVGLHKEWWDWYARVLAVRRAEIVPRLRGIAGHAGRWATIDDGAVIVRWTLGDDSELALAANLKPTPALAADLPAGRRLWTEGSAAGGRPGPWSAIFTLRPREAR